MRKYSLRQIANQYLKTDNRGSFRNKKHRAFVIHKVIDDLFVIGNVPASWKTLKIDHMQQLVQYWQKALDEHKLPINKSYRHLYAQQMKKQLSSTIGHYQLSWLIRDEMGIKSRNTLWKYLNE